MLHIFLSNTEDSYKYGTTGMPLDGYELKILSEDGVEVNQSEIGELYVKGDSAALMYWNNQKKSRATFQGEWTRTGDKYEIDHEGFYVYCGRSDDMMKVGGIYVSPTEVENALTTHLAVLEVAVVAQKDKEGLVKPKAYVVLNTEEDASESLANELKEYVKQSLAPYKYPRWVEFVDELPTTATGKIQRFKLRNLDKAS
jgi:benzoate-CoA ligase